jgi:acyl carrier protein
MLVEDLGLDSLEDIEAIMAIEEQTGITFTDEDAAGFRSLRDIIEYLRRRQDE